MDFESLDGYLLAARRRSPKSSQQLLGDGRRMRPPRRFTKASRGWGRDADLALLALRLVLAGRKADDAAVRRLRELSVARAPAM